jgi:hypothetical protein
MDYFCTFKSTYELKMELDDPEKLLKLSAQDNDDIIEWSLNDQV